MKTKGMMGCIILLSLLFAIPGNRSRISINPAKAGVELNSSYGNVQIELYGQLKGNMSQLAVKGDYVYVVIDLRFVVMDVSDQSNPMPVGQTEQYEGLAEDIVILGDYIYAAAGHTGLYIFDISNPTSPQKIALLPPTTSHHNWAAQDVALYESLDHTYAYINAYVEGVRVIDVTNPSSPVEVSFYDIPSSSSWDVAVGGDYLYVAYSDNGMHILNLNDPASPTYEGKYDIDTPSYSFYDVTVEGDYAYVASYYYLSLNDRNRMHVVDISNKTAPEEEGRSPGSRDYLYNLLYNNNIIYYTQGSYMSRYNVSNKTNPTVMGGYDLIGEGAMDVAICGSNAYTTSESTLHVFSDIASMPIALSGIYNTIDGTQALDIVGDHAFIGSGGMGLVSVNVQDPSNPVLEGYDDLSINNIKNPLTVDVQEGFAYVGSDYGFAVVDVSDPLNMVERGGGGGGIRDVEVRGQLVYVADRLSGLIAVGDVSDPDNPYWRGWAYAASYWSRDVKPWGDIAYLTDSAAVSVYDIPNPDTVSLAGRFQPVEAHDFGGLDVDGNLAYTTDWNGSSGLMRIIDFSNPATPMQVGSYSPLNRCQHLEIGKNYWLGSDKRFAYLAHTPVSLSSQVYLVDITNPSATVLLSKSSNLEWIRDFVVRGNYIYTAAGEDGLAILRQLRDVVTGTMTTAAGNLISTNADTQLSFPSGSFDGNVIVTYKHLWTDQDEYPRTGIGHTIDVTAVYSDTGEPALMQPGKKMTVEITYGDIGSAREDTLALYGWDEDSQEWSLDGIFSTVYPATNKITAQVNHLSLLAVLDDSKKVLLPFVIR